ncbi:MAG: flavodoxin family protein [Deltaproteobacteria bacterium]|nr:flavodoxin family protein [Deltaproteobacteria bacterium]
MPHNNEKSGLKVLGVSGSPRKNGNSDILLKQILNGVRESGLETEAIHLPDYQFQACIGCEKCRRDKICTGLNDGMTLLYPSLQQSQGLILVSPTHNYNITAWMKAFIDRLYCFYDFADTRPRSWSSRLAGQGRKALIAAVCEQKDKKDMGFTLDAMRLPLEALGYEITAELAAYSIFDKGLVKKENEIMIYAADLGKKLANDLQS